ncbi:MAG: type II toxin-antitoxin system VapC family toxin [Anaerolineae bacterium]|nr:type II toxin-antitoxin system VapC family toxin [Anaerolineae bacterium]
MTGTTRHRYLLDANAAIAILENDPAFRAAFSERHEALVPVIVLGELYAGAEKSARVEANLKRVAEFESRRSIVPCDSQTARQYARISQQLRKKGRPIPQNDMWIAALAMQHSLTLVTRDAHFSHVDGLRIQGW